MNRISAGRFLLVHSLAYRLETTSKLKGRLLKYASKHNLKTEGAVAALTLEDVEFAEDYNSLKNELKKQFEEWEGIFSPYFSSNKNQILGKVIE